jgi:predicted nucleic acid-binding protein
MSESVHYVFDTNTLVSALLFAHSKPGRAFRHALTHGRVLLSSSTIEELAEVLQRPKLERYVTAAEREEDNKFLELAVSGSASYIITGDEDLLVLHPFRNIVVVTPAAFLHTIEEGTAGGKA